MMPSLLLLLLIIMSQSCQLTAQYYFYNDRFYDKPLILEGGTGSGAMNCLTDLGGSNRISSNQMEDINLQFSRPFALVYFGGIYQQIIGFRIQFLAGTVYASDAVLKNSVPPARSRYLRNLHVRSPVYEWTILAEIHPLSWLAGPVMLSPYIIAGAGMFSFNPMAKLGDNWVPLHPLRTEGQGFELTPERKPYSLKSMTIPIGAGLRYELSAVTSIRLEFNYRVLNTDYLDDVSTTYVPSEKFYQYLEPEKARLAIRLSNRKKELDPLLTTMAGEKRGNPSNNDSWFTAGISIGFILNRTRK